MQHLLSTGRHLNRPENRHQNERTPHDAPLHPATIIALIALFVALAGRATAAGTALITGAQIKNGSVGLADLAPGE